MILKENWTRPTHGRWVLSLDNSMNLITADNIRMLSTNENQLINMNEVGKFTELMLAAVNKSAQN